MSMISEQIKRLREKADTFERSGSAVDGIVKELRQAADTIEELSAKLHNANMERSSAYYNGGWIPVSERLPEKLQDVLVTFYDAEGEYDVAYRRKTFNESYKAQGSEDEWVSSMGETTYADYEVSAWMPIKPYKASPTGAGSEGGAQQVIGGDKNV